MSTSMESSPSTATVKPSLYQNNPFMVPIDGLRLLFSRAETIAYILVGVLVFGFVANIFTMFIQLAVDYGDSIKSSPAATDTVPLQAAPASLSQLSPEQWAAILIGSLIAIALYTAAWLVGVYIKSVLDYASARVAGGHSVDLSDAARGGWSRFGDYVWLQIIVMTKLFLWSLLFIVPGLIMAVRYSLAGVSFYDKNLSGRAAVKDSLALTKNAWLTTFASFTLFNAITLGMAQPLIDIGTRIRLYQQLSTVTKHGSAKPEAHVLSWLTLIGVIIALAITLLVGTIIALVIASF